MICIYAIAAVKSGCTEAFLKTADSLINHSRAESGNIKYHLAKESDHTYVFMEFWRDEQAVAEHMAAPHFIEAGKKLEGVLEKALEIHKLEGIY